MSHFCKWSDLSANFLNVPWRFNKCPFPDPKCFVRDFFDSSPSETIFREEYATVISLVPARSLNTQEPGLYHDDSIGAISHANPFPDRNSFQIDEDKNSIE
jgi:hypothetical protein